MSSVTIDHARPAPDPDAPGEVPSRRSLRTSAANESTSIWRYLSASLGAAALLLMLALAAAVIVVPVATGSVPLTVLTSSMEPKLPPGTLLIVRPVAPQDIRIGDVVTYQIRSGEPDVITHRVIAISESTAGEREFILQGDNNGSPDPDPVREVQVQGRLWYSVPLIGWINTWVNGENRAWIIPVVAGALFAYAAWMLVSGAVERVRRRRRGRPSAPPAHHDDDA